MFCSNCGSQLKNGYAFCKVCGTKVDNNVSPRPVQAPNQPLRQIPVPQNKIAPQPQVIIYQPEPPDNQSDATIHHARKKGDDVSTSFGRAFGDITGTAVGCAAIIIGIIVVFIVIGFLAFL